jgi:peptidoglycan/xylan/chitin deacetylase (PgdA/CDA1 family)
MTTHNTVCRQNRGWLNKPPSLLHRVAQPAVVKAAAAMQILRCKCTQDGFGILMYHRVADRVPGVKSPTYNVTPQQLRQQLSGLLAHGFECWPLDRLIECNRRSQSIPSSVFAITFDDGYENTYLHAWPVLRELNLSATIFLATKYLDTQRPFPFDDWSATGSALVPQSAWRPLSTRQCQEMRHDGLIAFGAHTHSHERFLGRCDDFRADMRLCLNVLRDRLGIERPPFAFPYGETNEELIDAARNLDVSCSLSTAERRVLPGDDQHEWGRFCAGDKDTPAVLAAKLSGWHSAVIAAGMTLTSVWTRLASSLIRPHGNGVAKVTQFGLPAAREEAWLP